MTGLPRGYDEWRLAGPDEDGRPGECEGEECLRFPEPDDDAPYNYRPRRCSGTMTTEAGSTRCDTCGAEGCEQ